MDSYYAMVVVMRGEGPLECQEAVEAMLTHTDTADRLEFVGEAWQTTPLAGRHSLPEFDTGRAIDQRPLDGR